MAVERYDNRSRNTARLNIVVYFLLLLKAGFCFNEQYTRFTAPLYLILILFMNGKRVLRVDRSKSSIFFAYILLLSVNFLMNGFPSFERIIGISLNLITALLISNVLSEDEFFDSFRRVIFAICIASLVGFVIMYFFRRVSTIFPALVNSNGRIGRYAVLTILSDFASSTSGLQRVQGIFWEPGAFQTMIVFAVVFEIFKTKTLTWKRMAIYAITMLLTFSTTGYVCLMLLIALAVNKESRSFKMMRAGLIIAALLIFYFSLQDTSIAFLQYTMFGKIRMILNYQEGVKTYASSRVDSIVLPLRYFISNPIIGIGERGYSQIAGIAGHTMFTCTPVNYFARYGLIFGGISLWGIIKLFAKESISVVNGIVLALCLLITLSTEAFTLNPILTCMIMYGYGRSISEETKAV